MKKFILLIFTFLLTLTGVFATDVNLSVDKNNVDINNTFQLRLKVNIDESWQVAVKINWLADNFIVVGENRSQSTSSQITIINWKTKSVNVTTYNLILSLKAKKTWTYTIWPAVVEVWGKEYKSNTVQVKVSWSKIMLNNTQNYQPSQTTSSAQTHNPVWQVRNVNQTTQQPQIQNFEKDIKKIQPNNNLNLYFILALFILVWVAITIYVLNENKIDENVETDVVNIPEEVKKVDFEQQEITYPSLDDKDFENKIDAIFRQKLKEKFNIPNIENKTYTEILEQIQGDEKVKEIINWLKLLKYSNLVADKEKLLELVKEL
jgi:hypothetical protein